MDRQTPNPDERETADESPGTPGSTVEPTRHTRSGRSGNGSNSKQSAFLRRKDRRGLWTHHHPQPENQVGKLQREGKSEF